MRAATVIYNVDCIDSILTAAYLQTLGWTTYSNLELLPSNPGLHVWLAVIPTHLHFRSGNVNPNTRHVFYTYGFKTDRVKVQKALIKGVHFATTLLADTVNPVHRNKMVLLDQVCAIEEISSPEQTLLSWMIGNYYTSKHSDVIAITTLNVVRALEALKTREGFTPVRLPVKGVLDEDLMQAHQLVATLRTQTERFCSTSMATRTVDTKRGPRRLCISYGAENWWFNRRALRVNDIGINVNLGLTGSFISSSNVIGSNIEDDLNVPNATTVVV